MTEKLTSKQQTKLSFEEGFFLAGKGEIFNLFDCLRNIVGLDGTLVDSPFRLVLLRPLYL